MYYPCYGDQWRIAAPPRNVELRIDRYLDLEREKTIPSTSNMLVRKGDELHYTFWNNNDVSVTGLIQFHSESGFVGSHGYPVPPRGEISGTMRPDMTAYASVAFAFNNLPSGHYDLYARINE
jgi:hypothetical protein